VTTDQPDWWGVAEAASHCGIRPATWRGYVSTGHAPAPADLDDGAPKERRRPRWRPDTVRAWQDGRPKRPGRPRKHPGEAGDVGTVPGTPA